jgi:hypothetical protein
LPPKNSTLGQEAGLVVQGRENLKAVAQAGLVVLAAVARGGVHAAGARFEGHVVGGDHGRGAVVKRMAGDEAFEAAARHGGQRLPFGPAEFCGTDLGQIPGQDVEGIVSLDQVVLEVRVYGHGQVVRDGPGSGRPDDDETFSRCRLGENLRQFFRLKGKAHIDGRGGVVVVLDLRLGQGRLAGAAPVDGLLVALHGALFVEIGQLTRRGRLVVRGHGQVGLVPGAEHAQALELFALDIEVFECVLAAFFADFKVGELVLPAQFLLDFKLDGQTVTVPSRHVLGLAAGQVAVLDDDVFQDLVHGVADMDVPVGIGRAVVQDVGLPALIGGDHGTVGVRGVPAFQDLGLVLGQAALHGEGGGGKVQGFLVIAHGTTFLRVICCADGPRAGVASTNFRYLRCNEGQNSGISRTRSQV